MRFSKQRIYDAKAAEPSHRWWSTSVTQASTLLLSSRVVMCIFWIMCRISDTLSKIWRTYIRTHHKYAHKLSPLFFLILHFLHFDNYHFPHNLPRFFFFIIYAFLTVKWAQCTPGVAGPFPRLFALTWPPWKWLQGLFAWTWPESTTSGGGCFFLRCRAKK